MPNITTLLNDEIRRLARKEIKSQAEPGDKAAGRHKKELAELKKRVNELEKRIHFLTRHDKKQSTKPAKPAKAVRAKPTTGADGEALPRFSPKWVKKHRDKLGMSAADYGLLAGVSGLTIYNWEKGNSNPRTKQLMAWSDIRTLGKREAQKKLDEIKAGGGENGDTEQPADAEQPEASSEAAAAA